MPAKLQLFRWLKYKYLTFIRIKDSPRSIAIGAALGISFDVLPTFGAGIILAYFVALIIRVNRLAAVITAVVFKLAIPLFVYINIKTGSLFIKENYILPPLDLASFSWLHLNWQHLGVSYLLGSLLNACLVFVGTYLLIYLFIRWRNDRAASKKKPRGC